MVFTGAENVFENMTLSLENTTYQKFTDNFRKFIYDTPDQNGGLFKITSCCHTCKFHYCFVLLYSFKQSITQYEEGFRYDSILGAA